MPSWLLAAAFGWLLAPASLALGEGTKVGAVSVGQHAAAHPIPRMPPPPRAQVAVLLDGPTILESGTPYDAHLIALDAASSAPPLGAPGSGGGTDGDVSFSLIQAPLGLTLDPDSGALHWVPSDNQVGENLLEIGVFTPELFSTAEFTLRVQGLKVEAEAFLPAATGGWIRVLAASSAVVGSSILIPPGALGTSQEINLCTPLQSLQLPEIAQGLYVLPAQELIAPAELEISYGAAWLASAGIADESKLAAFEFDEATHGWLLLPSSVPDPLANKVRFSTTRLGRFALFVRDGSGLQPEVEQELEKFWELFLGGGLAAPAPSGGKLKPDRVLSIAENLNQPRHFVWVKGGRFEPDKKNALLIHGAFSSDVELAELEAWAETQYDNVKVYDYPSGQSIQANARWLGVQLITDPLNFEWGSCVDVYAHSLGGLVARALIEDAQMYGCRSFAPFVHLSTLGTPHQGAEVSSTILSWIKMDDYPGLQDALSGSDFLDKRLNVPPGQGWSKYFAIAGDAYGDNDGLVKVSSAVPSGPFEITESVVIPGEDHTGLHSHMPGNHVGEWLKVWVQPKSIRADQIELLSHEVHVTHAPLGPTQYETEWESVEVTATLRFDPDFFMPPWIPIQARWTPTDPELGYCELEFVKQHLFLDDSYPELLALLQSIPGAFEDDPSKETALHQGPLAGELTFKRRREHVPVCYPAGYVPQPGVPVPAPDLSIDLMIGFEPDLVILSTQF